ncbi:MAG: hypothetical protein K0U86_04075 [Planctomycetes bacterium]|nr:hypothetical protein [Planctomycetota bacterium]MCH9724063.1 hypothetical protein [Planctomycetota bacterium]MCH9778119.1 hypothetical protein [Planctomycetota bacterium]MCH9790208.1 hypothetical protein [Planctomycetota bacterium]
MTAQDHAYRYPLFPYSQNVCFSTRPTQFADSKGARGSHTYSRIHRYPENSDQVGSWSVKSKQRSSR